jgi:SH3 domain protein
MGRAVEVVRDDPQWSLIRLPDGTEGWVSTRFLVSAPLLPHGIHAAEAEAENDSIDLQALFRNLVEENDQLREELAAWTTERNTQPDSVLSVTRALDESLRQLEELRAECAVAHIENTVLKKNEAIKWFLAGSGTLLLGWFIGRMTGGGVRRKKSSLL